MIPALLLLAAVPASAHLKINGHANYGARKYMAAGNNPLAKLDFSEWWFHGELVNDPPPEGVMHQLPAGGVFEATVSCNTGVPARNLSAGCCDTTMLTPYDLVQDVRGCGIAIAYESDVTKIQPEDFAVISTNYTCPWVQATAITAGLPSCPEDGCHCMWGWIHSPEGGSFGEMYFIGSRCNVTGETGTVPIPKPNVARKCPFDKDNCTAGAKQPHYWFQDERNNNLQGVNDPPFYNGDYSFMNGAQTDLWEVPDESLYAHECDWAPMHQGYLGGWGTSRNARTDYDGTPLVAKVHANMTNNAPQCANWTKEAVATSSVTSTVVTSSSAAASSLAAAAASPSSAAAAASSSSAAAASSTSSSAPPAVTTYKYAPADDSDIKAWVLEQMRLDKAGRTKRDEAGVAQHKAGRQGGHGKRRGQF